MIEYPPTLRVARRSRSDQASRQKAKAAGLLRYEGDPCVRCGEKTRNVSQGKCVACMSLKRAQRYVRDRDLAQTNREWSIDEKRTYWLTKAWRAA